MELMVEQERGLTIPPVRYYEAPSRRGRPGGVLRWLEERREREARLVGSGAEAR